MWISSETLAPERIRKTTKHHGRNHFALPQLSQQMIWMIHKDVSRSAALKKRRKEILCHQIQQTKIIPKRNNAAATKESIHVHYASKASNDWTSLLGRLIWISIKISKKAVFMLFYKLKALSDAYRRKTLSVLSLFQKFQSNWSSQNTPTDSYQRKTLRMSGLLVLCCMCSSTCSSCFFKIVIALVRE